jgi:ribosomal protein S18 acetylase RimI-like enzyme
VNSTWPLGWTGEVGLDQAIDQVEAWYRRRGRAAWFRLADGLSAPPELAAALTQRGYVSDTPTLTLTRALTPIEADADVSFEAGPGEAFLAPMREDAPSAADYAERRGVLLRTPGPRAFAMLLVDDKPAAVGASVVTGDLAMIFVMRTARWARRRGMARRVLRALMGWGYDQSATTAHLQVEQGNAAAVALYASEGFATAYRYVYWRPRP